MTLCSKQQLIRNLDRIYSIIWMYCRTTYIEFISTRLMDKGVFLTNVSLNILCWEKRLKKFSLVYFLHVRFLKYFLVLYITYIIFLHQSNHFFILTCNSSVT